ncbi:NACHT C-terminal helical domain 2-containing protein [Pseudanabaena yagii]|uniref:NACHT conflict system C-terminal helical domain-containing protein n=1 Tax=Pseudanabaena yagii GIHE-NHR1 TaxID=2722753 RepID=A0ABX1LWQ0_9CYAN|nr:hypothetical protein [Pseudanabaena yagii]NMF60620.1 hypothetical protein [Pseudanabaena yagii GIHE-NHR1]
MQQSSPEILEELVSHLFDKKWREVFLLTVEMSPQRSANHLLLKMKIAIDNLLAEDEKLQSFLHWVNEKSIAVTSPYKLEAIRAYYLSFYCFSFSISFTFAGEKQYEMSRELALDLDLSSNIDRNITRKKKIQHFNIKNINQKYEFDLFRTIETYMILLVNRELLRKGDLSFISREDNDVITMLKLFDSLHYDESLDLINYIQLNLERELQTAFDHILKYTKTIKGDREYQCLQDLRDLMPDPNQNLDSFNSWWLTNAQEWTEKLRLLIIQYYNIGHEWKFTEEQEQKLNNYYKANQLLVECMKSDCNVSREVRQKIENTLLLPLLHPDNQT